MPAKKKIDAPLYQRLIDGLDVKSRKDGSVHTIRVDRKVVAEVCVGRSTIRLNVRPELPAAQRKLLSGKSKSWPGGGLIVTDENLDAARKLIEFAVQRQEVAA